MTASPAGQLRNEPQRAGVPGRRRASDLPRFRVPVRHDGGASWPDRQASCPPQVTISSSRADQKCGLTHRVTHRATNHGTQTDVCRRSVVGGPAPLRRPRPMDGLRVQVRAVRRDCAGRRSPTTSRTLETPHSTGHGCVHHGDGSYSTRDGVSRRFPRLRRIACRMSPRRQANVRQRPS